MSTNKYDIIEYFDPRLCRAARSLLDWSQGDLAAAASIGVSTVADYERGSRKPIANNLKALIRALEEGGVVFIPPNEGGAGVRFREPGS
ncbi:helix-turn-helix domain-containing protein [Yunchengibacter salinarum]|uniref:helix-turn-helix domain-containing protein n=1 Tax=Yunchengibacter salinarum TaxID=3133399 RepID=UPI0035B6761B